MKKIALTTVIILATFSVAFADWLIDFQDVEREEGIDVAVVGAMKDGAANPDMIVEAGLQIDGMNPTNLIKALLCAGAKGADVRSAAEKWKLSDLVIEAGFKKYPTECSDAQAFSDGQLPGFVNLASSKNPPASNSGFSQ